MNTAELELEQVAAEMAIYSDLLVASGLLHLKGGNHSVRCGPRGDELIITRTGSFKRDLVPERLIRASVHCDDPVENASSVLSMHRAIYRRTDARAVIHAHPYHPALLSFYVDQFTPVDENGLIYLGPVIKVVAAREFMGWAAADAAMAEALAECPAAILKWHGTFAIGDSLAQAFHNTQAVESAARFYLDTLRLRAALGMPEIAPYVADPPWMDTR
ncbi:MAG: class II aldolase/adducin family protein [Spirochaetaceae bacterium]|nr:class II aldolase/adducin family protein [Spirochaetaceae bacterium]